MDAVLSSLERIQATLNSARLALGLQDVAVDAYWHAGLFSCTVYGPRCHSRQLAASPDEVIRKSLDVLRLEAKEQGVVLADWIERRRSEREAAERFDLLIVNDLQPV